MTQLLKSSTTLIFFCAILISNATKTFSQSTHITPLINQVYTNFNYGSANSDLNSFKKNAIGYMAGISFQAGITQNFSVVTETYFTMKGGTLKNNNNITTGESTIRLYNIETPILARLHVQKFYINAGPYVSYAIAGKIKIDATDSQPSVNKSINFNNEPDGFKRWDLGIQAGAGYNFRIKKTKLALDMRYGYGLTNISNDVARYNRSFTVSIVIIKAWKTNPFAIKSSNTNSL